MMSNPWLPSYLGTWQDLIESLLHDPFLGSGRDRRSRVILAVAAPDIEPDHGPLPLRIAGPSPSPWLPAVSFLISGISLKEVASGLPGGEGRDVFGKSAGHAITTFNATTSGTA